MPPMPPMPPTPPGRRQPPDDPNPTRSASTSARESRLDRLVELLAKRSARRGQFTLASGRQSSLYIDARLTTMHPDGLILIGPLGLEMLRDSDWGQGVTAVGGLTLGADPISYAISYASAAEHQRTTRAVSSEPSASRSGAADAGSASAAALRAFTVRKAAKDHGTGKLVEGPFDSGDRVAIIEDVITTGGSALQAVDAVRAAGGIPAGVLALVDREEGGRAAIEAAGLPVLILVRAAQIVERMELAR